MQLRENLCFDSHVLHVLSSSLSEHCLLLLANDSSPQHPRSLKFEKFLLKMPGFEEISQESKTISSDERDL
jgi:hypothetical protein